MLICKIILYFKYQECNLRQSADIFKINQKKENKHGRKQTIALGAVHCVL